MALVHDVPFCEETPYDEYDLVFSEISTIIPDILIGSILY